MKITTRSRYGVRLMLELAGNYGKGQVLLKDIARNEGISEKYLSLIIIPLRTAGLVQSTRGAHGGYSLAKPPGEITLKDIVLPDSRDSRKRSIVDGDSSRRSQYRLPAGSSTVKLAERNPTRSRSCQSLSSLCVAIACPPLSSSLSTARGVA